MFIFIMANILRISDLKVVNYTKCNVWKYRFAPSPSFFKRSSPQFWEAMDPIKKSLQSVHQMHMEGRVVSVRLTFIIGQLLCRILGSKFLLELFPLSFYLWHEVGQTKGIYSEFMLSKWTFKETIMMTLDVIKKNCGKWSWILLNLQESSSTCHDRNTNKTKWKGPATVWVLR